jgi:hypothetical protein
VEYTSTPLNLHGVNIEKFTFALVMSHGKKIFEQQSGVKTDFAETVYTPFLSASI